MALFDQENIEEVDVDKEAALNDSKINAIKFLAEYAKDTSRPYNKVAEKVGINRKTAQGYLKKYIYLIERTKNDDDFLQTVLEFYNYDLVQKGVDESRLFKAGYVQLLQPLLGRYGRVLEQLDMADKPESEKKSSSYINKDDSNSYGAMALDDDEDELNTDPEDERIDSGLRELADSSNTRILRKVLRHIPEIGAKHVPHIISLFRMREDELMRDPNNFMDFLMDYFNGRHRKAKLVFDGFKSMVQKYGGDGSGFGVNPYTGVPYEGTDQYNQYRGHYGQMRAGPYGITPEMMQSPQYIQYLAEIEKRKAMKEESEGIDRDIGRYVKTATISMLQGANGGQKQNNDDWMKYAMMGLVRPRITFNQQTGQQEVVLEPTLAGGQGGGFGGNGQGGDNSIMNTLLQGMIQQNNTLLQSQMKPAGGLFDEALKTMIAKSMGGDNSVEKEIEKYKMMQEMFGGGKGHVKTPAELDIDLKKEEFDFKKSIMIQKMQSDDQRRQFEMQAQQRQEDKADQNTKDIINGITQTIQFVLGPIMAGLQHGTMPEGLKSMMGGAGGQPQQQQQVDETQMGAYNDEIGNLSPTTQAFLERQRDDIVRNANEQAALLKKQQEAAMAAQGMGMQPQQNINTQPNMQQAPTQQQIEQQAQEIDNERRKAEIGKKFTERDFEGYTEEELIEAKKMGMAQVKSLKTFNQSIDSLLSKFYHVRNDAFTEEQKQPEEDVLNIPDVDPDYTGGIKKKPSKEILAQPEDEMYGEQIMDTPAMEKESAKETQVPSQAQDVDTNAIFGIAKAEEIKPIETDTEEVEVKTAPDIEEVELPADDIIIRNPPTSTADTSNASVNVTFNTDGTTTYTTKVPTDFTSTDSSSSLYGKNIISVNNPQESKEVKKEEKPKVIEEKKEEKPSKSDKTKNDKTAAKATKKKSKAK